MGLEGKTSLIIRLLHLCDVYLENKIEKSERKKRKKKKKEYKIIKGFSFEECMVFFSASFERADPSFMSKIN